MTYAPNPKQALFLWRLVTSETPDGSDFMLSKARPTLSPAERQTLIQERFVTLEAHPGVRGKYFALTDKAWAWAGDAVDVTLLKSNSKVGAEALEGLLRRLLPFLHRQELALADVFSTTSSKDPEPLEPDAASLAQQIERACLAISGGARQTRVRLSELRRILGAVSRDSLDHALLRLQDERRLVLYRDDNTAALTDDDHRAALSVGGAPRHLVYLET